MFSEKIEELENDFFEGETIWLSADQTWDLLTGFESKMVSIYHRSKTISTNITWLKNIPFIGYYSYLHNGFGTEVRDIVPFGLRIPRGIRSFEHAKSELNLRHVNSLYSLIKKKRVIQQETMSLLGKHLWKIVYEYGPL